MPTTKGLGGVFLFFKSPSMRMPTNCDKAALIAAPTLIAAAPAILYSSQLTDSQLGFDVRKLRLGELAPLKPEAASVAGRFFLMYLFVFKRLETPDNRDSRRGGGCVEMPPRDSFQDGEKDRPEDESPLCMSSLHFLHMTTCLLPTPHYLIPAPLHYPPTPSPGPLSCPSLLHSLKTGERSSRVSPTAETRAKDQTCSVATQKLLQGEI